MQTPWCMPPASVPLDLESSDEQIFRLAEAMLESAAGHMNRTDWHARMLSRMIEEGTIEQRASE